MTTAQCVREMFNYRPAPATSPAPLFALDTLGAAMLYHMKQGILVTKIRVMLTHTNVHAIWSGDSAFGKRLRTKYPLEVKMPRLFNEEAETIDCRKFIVPWDIQLPDHSRPAPIIYPKDTGDPVKDFHPPHVEPLTILDEPQQVEPYGPA